MESVVQCFGFGSASPTRIRLKNYADSKHRIALNLQDPPFVECGVRVPRPGLWRPRQQVQLCPPGGGRAKQTRTGMASKLPVLISLLKGQYYTRKRCHLRGLEQRKKKWYR